MSDERPRTIEELREELARQILETAIESDNPQFKVDAFKALEKWGMTRGKQATASEPGGAMHAFQARVRRAEEGNGDGEPAETD